MLTPDEQAQWTREVDQASRGRYSTRQIVTWFATGLGVGYWRAQKRLTSKTLFESVRALMLERGVRSSAYYGLGADLPKAGSLEVVGERVTMRD